MDTVTHDDATYALQVLVDAALEYQKNLQEYAHLPTKEESDDDADLPYPVFHSFFHTGGSEAIIIMTNVSPVEFSSIWSRIHDHIFSNWNIGRGRKSGTKPKDDFFMLLTIIKHGGR